MEVNNITKDDKEGWLTLTDPGGTGCHLLGYGFGGKEHGAGRGRSLFQQHSTAEGRTQGQAVGHELTGSSDHS